MSELAEVGVGWRTRGVLAYVRTMRFIHLGSTLLVVLSSCAPRQGNEQQATHATERSESQGEMADVPHEPHAESIHSEGAEGLEGTEGNPATEGGLMDAEEQNVQVDARGLANVIAVRTQGESGKLTFAVRVQSPDEGCDSYADFWEVLSPAGELLYRRILAHSHVNEQPFTRSGGPVPVARDAEVIVRAHMAPGGYGGAAMRGSAVAGFATTDLPRAFAAELEKVEPQPEDCAR